MKKNKDQVSIFDIPDINTKQPKFNFNLFLKTAALEYLDNPQNAPIQKSIWELARHILKKAHMDAITLTKKAQNSGKYFVIDDFKTYVLKISGRL